MLALDLRAPGRVFVRLTAEAAAARADARAPKKKDARHELPPAPAAHAPDPGPQERGSLGARRRRVEDGVPDRAAGADGAVGALRGRTHRCKILGIGHQRSNGVKGGAIVDLDAAEHAIRLAIDAAERMAGVEVESVIVNMSGAGSARNGSAPRSALRGKAVSEHDVHRALEAASAASAQPARTVLHGLPTAFSLDASATSATRGG